VERLLGKQEVRANSKCLRSSGLRSFGPTSGRAAIRFAGGTRLIFGQSWCSVKVRRFQPLLGIPRVAGLRSALNILRPSLPLAGQAWQLTPAPAQLINPQAGFVVRRAIKGGWVGLKAQVSVLLERLELKCGVVQGLIQGAAGSGIKSRPAHSL
jgi:hypothetical protein